MLWIGRVPIGGSSLGRALYGFCYGFFLHCGEGKQGWTSVVGFVSTAPQRFTHFFLDRPISPWHGNWEFDICSQKKFGKPSHDTHWQKRIGNPSGTKRKQFLVWSNNLLHLKSFRLQENSVWLWFTFGFPSDLQWSQSVRNCSSKLGWLQHVDHLRVPCHSPQSIW